MKNTKWVDIRIGEDIFTVRCNRFDDNAFGTVVSFDVYEQHQHPTNFLKRFIEFWGYEHLASGKWIESLSNVSLQERIIRTCEYVVDSNYKHLNAIKEWENL